MKKLLMGWLGLIALLVGPMMSAQACTHLMDVGCGDTLTTNFNNSIYKDYYSAKYDFQWNWDSGLDVNTITSATFSLGYSDISADASDEIWTIHLKSGNTELTSILDGSGSYTDTFDSSEGIFFNSLLSTKKITYWFTEGTNDKDNFKLGTATLSFQCAVPIPAAAPLFLGGLGLVGWAGRRRRASLKS